MVAYSGNLNGSNSDYFDRQQQQEQFEEWQKLEKQKISLQKQELQVYQQQQDINQVATVGGLILGSLFVLAMIAFVISKIKTDGRG